MRPGELTLRKQVAGDHRWQWWAFFLVALFSLWQGLGTIRNEYTLELGFSESLHGAPKLYYDEGQGFNEQDSLVGTLRDGNQRALFRLPDKDSRAYRLDPPSAPTQQTITSAVLYSTHGWRLGHIDLLKVNASVQTELLASKEGTFRYRIIEKAHDPQLVLPAITDEAVVGTRTQVSDAIARLVLSAVLAAVLVFIALEFMAGRGTFGGVVGFGLACALVVTYTFAVSTDLERAYNPDEISHFAAAKYFLDHPFPPAVLEPDTFSTLSVYGSSYLYELDVVYWIAGRLVHYLLADRFVSLTAFRIFNVALLVLLALVAWYKPKARLPLSVLLLTPQAWYTFSYFNADALPLAAGLIAVVLAAPANSRLSRYVANGGRPGIAVALFVLAVGLLLLSKRNYLPLVPFLALCLVVRHLRMRAAWAACAVIGLLLVTVGWFLGNVSALAGWHFQLPILVAGSALLAMCGIPLWSRINDDKALCRPAGRLALIFVVASLVALPRVGYDVYLNGMPAQKAEAVRAVAEAHAGEAFKPSRLFAVDNPTGVQLANRGVSLGQIAFEPYHWFATSIESSFGVFGYMDVHLPKRLYSLFQFLFLVALACAIYGLLRVQFGLAYVVLGIGFSAIVAIDSLMHSWTGDFQPQGRYLLPILPIVAAMLAQGGAATPIKWLKPTILATTLMSIHAMVSVAMPGVGAAAASCGAVESCAERRELDTLDLRIAAVDERSQWGRLSHPGSRRPCRGS